MILKAKHHFLLYPFFSRYVIWKMHRNFHSVNIKGKIEDKRLPVVLICNHASWWDGIWAFHINRTQFHRKYYFMMLEEQLRKYWFLNYVGGYSVPAGSKGKLESINYTLELLKDSGNLVLIFPQGEIESMHKQHFTFKKGIAHILQRAGNDVQVVFLVNITDYHENVRPTVYSFLTEYTGSNERPEIEAAYNRFYTECISEQVKIVV